jgi:hypothetical protein
VAVPGRVARRHEEVAVARTTTAPARPQIAESLDPQVGGFWIRWRPEQSEFQTCRIFPFPAAMTTTCPWYGGVSPM